MPLNSAPRYVIGLDAIGADQVGAVGGKAAGLAALSSLPDVVVPPGVCVTTAAYARCVADDPEVAAGLAALAGAGSAAGLRAALAKVTVPDDIVAALAAGLGPGHNTRTYAVRSSATAEDLPGASFAGQHDSFLEVQGLAAVLDAIRRCWASLFTDRAIAYRHQHDLDAHDVQMAVVVQEMIAGQASGVVFTADPLSGHRQVVCIEAVRGLGDALVSGRETPDTYRVMNNAIVDPGTRGPSSVLRDEQVMALARLAQRTAEHLGAPQDIEWCLAADQFAFVQSRPITTLFPPPRAPDDERHVYISVGHQQMMTDAFKPLGLSVWQHTTPAPMAEAGGRLFVDVTRQLSSPDARDGFLTLMGRSDPLMRDALDQLLARPNFLPPAVTPPAPPRAASPDGGPPPPPSLATVERLIDESRAALDELALRLSTVAGPDLVPFILDDIQRLRAMLFDPRSYALIMAAYESTWWLNEHLEAWLGEKGLADPLAQAAPHNVTADMGLALLDVADAIRPWPAVVARLRAVTDEDHTWRADLLACAGGQEVCSALDGFLRVYGMRCLGEIDITRTRWAEQPSALVPTLLHHVDHVPEGEAARRRALGRAEAAAAERRILERLRQLPDGEDKAEATRLCIQRLRVCIGYREYPKYTMIARYALYKQAILREAERLVAAGALRARDDVFYLRLEELQEVFAQRRVDGDLVAARRAAHRHHRTLTPPRVLTSDGEAVAGRVHLGPLPAGTLAGLAVSAGVVEGTARVVRRLSDARLGPDDILVTAHTDPSWSPVFVGIAGLVTEVGGLMTHGAVVAREYGLPAVVGVDGATTRIRDGQRIRIDGAAGTVELLADEITATKQ